MALGPSSESKTCRGWLREDSCALYDYLGLNKAAKAGDAKLRTLADTPMDISSSVSNLLTLRIASPSGSALTVWDAVKQGVTREISGVCLWMVRPA